MNGTVACGDCGTILIDETPQDATRQPCPECGSPKRHITMEFSDEIKLYEQLRVRQKEKGTKGAVHDQTSGDDYTHSSGTYNKKVRIIDRRNDHYYECVTHAQTGEILHLRDEKLSEHFGRGSAKFQAHGLPSEHIAIAAYYIWQKEGEPHGRHLNHWSLAIEDLKRAQAGVPTLYS